MSDNLKNLVVDYLCNCIENNVNETMSLLKIKGKVNGKMLVDLIFNNNVTETYIQKYSLHKNKNLEYSLTNNKNQTMSFEFPYKVEFEGFDDADRQQRTILLSPPGGNKVKLTINPDDDKEVYIRMEVTPSNYLK